MKRFHIKKYYIEVVDIEKNKFIIQSKWFDNADDAIEFIKENFDFIYNKEYAVDLISALFDDEGYYQEMKLEKRLEAWS